MRRALLALALVSLVGCEASNLERAASVVVSGRVLRADGSPAGGVPVALEREPSVGETLTGLLAVPLTLFTACLADPPPTLCRGRSIKRATTAADGTYSFDLTGRETQTLFGNTVSFSLTTEVTPVAGELSGAAVTAGFRIQTENLRLPDLQVWQPAVSVTAGGVAWRPAAPGGGESQVVVEDAAGQPVWSFDGTRSEVAFDPRILEDTAGGVAVTSRLRTTAEGTTVTVLRRSGRVAYRSAAGPPASRGRHCTRGPAATPVAPCPLTDGDLANRLPGAPGATSTTAPSTVQDAVTVDLGRAAEVSLVVVRGCACQVERSTDGQAWTAIGRATGFTAVVPSRTGLARYVRLTGPLSDLREVSVWEGAAPPATAPPATTPAAPPGGSGPTAAGAQPGGESRQGPALVALLALVGAAVATAAAAAAAARPGGRR